MAGILISIASDGMNSRLITSDKVCGARTLIATTTSSGSPSAKSEAKSSAVVILAPNLPSASTL